jgi:hypothetical protein
MTPKGKHGKLQAGCLLWVNDLLRTKAATDYPYLNNDIFKRCKASFKCNRVVHLDQYQLALIVDMAQSIVAVTSWKRSELKVRRSRGDLVHAQSRKLGMHAAPSCMYTAHPREENGVPTPFPTWSFLTITTSNRSWYNHRHYASTGVPHMPVLGHPWPFSHSGCLVPRNIHNGMELSVWQSCDAGCQSSRGVRFTVHSTYISKVYC